MIFVYLAMILVATFVIGAFLKRMLPLWLLVRGIQRANEEEEKRSREEYEKHQKWEEQYHKEKQAKIDHMINKGYERVIGVRYDEDSYE